MKKFPQRSLITEWKISSAPFNIKFFYGSFRAGAIDRRVRDNIDFSWDKLSYPS
jgi:hypothetical protein